MRWLGRQLQNPWTYVLAAALLAGAAVWLAFAIDEQVRLRWEIVTLLLNLAVIGMLGGMIQLLLNQWRRQREKDEAHRAFQTHVAERLGEVHRNIYVVRRELLLLLRTREPDFAERTRRQVRALMQARASLGDVKHRIIQSELNDQAADPVSEMREYLEEIINAYLDNPDDPEVFQRFIEGIGTHSECEYDRRFKAPYKRAKDTLLQT